MTLLGIARGLVCGCLGVLTILGYLIAAPLFMWISWSLEGNFHLYTEAIREGIATVKNPFPQRIGNRPGP
jgi:hypothetical protein